MKKYITIWWILALKTTQSAFISRLSVSFLLLGKTIRFFLYLLFLIVLTSRVHAIAGYTLWQMIFFFLTFNLVDILPQLLFREVYRFRGYIISGDFDYFLIKPISPLFRSLLGGSDALDLSIFVITIIFIMIAAHHVCNVTLVSTIAYIILIFISLMISLSAHILVLAFGILTTEVDNAMLMYRDFVQMGRIPVDIYTEPLRSIITFAIPVGVMVTFPAKAFMGLLSPLFVVISVSICVLLLFVSIRFWKFALRSYSSASS